MSRRPRPSPRTGVPAPGARPLDAPLPDGYRIDPRPHVAWARAMARVVRAEYHFAPNSAEERDLEAAAYIVLCRYARRFDHARVRPDSTPGELLRGWSKRSIVTECRREARRLARKGLAGEVVEGQPRPRCANCSDLTSTGSMDEFERAALDGDEGGEEVKEEACEYEPRLVILRNGKPVA